MGASGGREVWCLARDWQQPLRVATHHSNDTRVGIVSRVALCGLCVHTHKQNIMSTHSSLVDFYFTSHAEYAKVIRRCAELGTCTCRHLKYCPALLNYRLLSRSAEKVEMPKLNIVILSTCTCTCTCSCLALPCLNN